MNTAKSYPRGLNPICQYGHFRTGAITSNLAHGSVLGAGLIRQRCKIVTLLCAFICVGQFLFAVDLVWTNIAGGAWNTAANWWPNQVPTTNDHVWITNGGTYTVTISGNAAAGELTLGGTTGTQTVSVTGGTFLIGNGTGNTNAVLRITGGTLGGTGKLILAGPLNWSGGSITNAVVQCAGGTISGSATKTLRYGCLVNTGVLKFSGGYLEPNNGATISNLPSATFDISGDCDISYYASGSGPIYNLGVFCKSGGTGQTLVDTLFYNQAGGTVVVQTGTIRFSSGGQFKGTIVLHGSGTLDLYAGVFDLDPELTSIGDGTLGCSGSAVVNLQREISVNVLNVTGGQLTGLGRVVANTLRWETGIIECTVLCDGGEILTSATTVPKLRGGRLVNTGLLRGGTISTTDGAIISNLVSGIVLFTNATAGIRHDSGDYGAFYNMGFVQSGVSTTTCSIGEPFYNAGTVESCGAGLRFARSFVQTAGRTIVSEGPLICSQGINLVGGELLGTNTIRGDVTNNSKIRPGGFGLGLLRIEGSYVETTNARVELEVGGPTPGVGHDQLIVTNMARLAGTLEIVLTNEFIPGRGVVITGLVYEVRSGTFNFTVKPVEIYVLYMPKEVLLETENAPPAVQLVVGPDQLACHTFEMRGSARDPDGTITNFTLLVDGISVGEFPYGCCGKAAVCMDYLGEVMVTGRATDNKGAMGETNIVIRVIGLPIHMLDPVGFQTNGAFKLCMCGQPGSNYVIEIATNLPAAIWTTLGPMENTNGIWRYFDVTGTNVPHKFYRARQL